MKWLRTMADYPSIMRRYWAGAGGHSVFDPHCLVTEVVAPCCGRVTCADTVIDCREIPNTIVRGGNWRAPEDHAWLCDGCVHILYRDESNNWTQSRFIEAHGAPAQLVHHYRMFEDARDIINTTFAGRSHNPQEILDGAWQALVVDHRAKAEAEAEVLLAVR